VKRQRGFTLIETMVAIALLAVIVITVLSGFSATTIATTRHQQETNLDRVTRSNIEFVKSQAYITSAGVGTNPNYQHIVAAGFNFSTTILFYNKNSNPTFAATNTDTGLQEIIVTVTGPGPVSEQVNFLKELP
jgi:prepilin-type N-terminal cleavage/methylation domain-containing protein